jgi:regulator of protease activity HflC (stomatin/prohibitin superfamily)
MIPIFGRGPDNSADRFPPLNVVAIAILLGALGLGILGSWAARSALPLLVMTLVGVLLMPSPQIARQWERAVVLRFGRFVGLRGPGLFWMVHDAEKAALEVQDYAQAVSWAAQTALRDIIGRTTLTDLLRGRERIEEELQQLIDQRSNPWGVTVSSVEMRDVVIPGALQDAMSREAQAAREKQARIILGQAEMEIAHSFQEAAKSYHDDPTALHLRAMNMLYEGLKEKGRSC